MSKLFSLPRFAAVLLTVVVLAFASSATAQDPDYYLLPVTATSGATTLTFSGEIEAGPAQTGLKKGNVTQAINAFSLNDGTQTYTATQDIQIQSLGFSSSNERAFDLQSTVSGGSLTIFEDTAGTVTLSGETVADKTISVTWSISANEVVITDPLGTYMNTDGSAIPL